MAASAQFAAAAAAAAAASSRRVKRIHDNAATPYLTLEDELLDVAEEVTPLPTDLIKLVLGFADLLGYRVLPRGPVQLASARTMPASMQSSPAYRDPNHSSDMRFLSFRGGGSLVLTAPLLRPFDRKRKRLRVNPPIAQAAAAAAPAAAAVVPAAATIEERSSSQTAAVSETDEAESVEAAASYTPFDASLVSQVALYDRKCAWHVDDLLLGADALTYDAKRGWIVGVETTTPKSLMDKCHTAYERLTVKPPPLTRLHQRRFKYYRALPFGINLIADGSQPPATMRSAWYRPAGTPEEEASVVTRGHEGDDLSAGITLVYARGRATTTTDVTPRPSPAQEDVGMKDANHDDQRLVRMTAFFQVAPAARGLSRKNLLSPQTARAFFRRHGQCEFGLAQCRDRVHPECLTSCCSAEHCAQVNRGQPCALH